MSRGYWDQGSAADRKGEVRRGDPVIVGKCKKCRARIVSSFEVRDICTMCKAEAKK